MSNRDDEPFVARWSRRKAQAARGRVPDEAEGDDDHTIAVPDPAIAAVDERIPAPSPPPDVPPADDFADVDFAALDYQSDYGRFMQAGVPDGIRRQALQKLWHSDPIFTQVDPFQDYAGDYTDAAVAVPGGLIKTAYKLGQGFLSDEEAAVWDRLGKPDIAAAAAAMPPVAIAFENPDQPEVHAFIAASEAYMGALYPAESNHFAGIGTLLRPNVRFLVARRGGTAVGCGAIVIADDRSAEIKRMWIAPAARGAKLGRRILEALEAAARVEGVTALRLETGISQPEALGLYRAAGFVEIGPFGDYRPDPLSVFMEKELAAGEPHASIAPPA